jgi:hypothetical protein
MPSPMIGHLHFVVVLVVVVVDNNPHHSADVVSFVLMMHVLAS